MCVCVSLCSTGSDSLTPWAVAHQAPPSIGFSRQKYWSGLTFPSPGSSSNPGIKPVSLTSPALQEDASPLSHQGSSYLAREGHAMEWLK